MPVAAPRSPPRTIDALVRRHAEDAAFYWTQLDAAAMSPRIGLEGIARFQGLLGAHLDGLFVAGESGQLAAFKALDRWMKPGEAYVAAWLSLRRDDAASLAAVMQLVARQPAVLLRGLIGALACLPADAASRSLRMLSGAPDNEIAQVAALRAAALRGANGVRSLAQPVSHYLRSSSMHVAAAACRAASVVPKDEASMALLQGLLGAPGTPGASAAPVRAEAAIALHAGRRATGGPATAALWQSIVLQASVLSSATGWERRQAQRRLNRWVRCFGWMAPHGHGNLPGLFEFLPSRLGLGFALSHGDPAHLRYVVRQMAQPESAAYAGWVWQTLTGLPLPARASPLTREGAVSAALDGDDTLPLPDIAAVNAVHVDAPPGGRILLGQPLTVELAHRLLADGTAVELHALASTALYFLQPGHAQARVGFHTLRRTPPSP